MVPGVTTVNAGPSSRRMKSWDPHLAQKHLRRLGDDSYSEITAAPDVTVSASLGTNAFVENAAPCALRHMVQ
jgi:hypothetical protein